MAQSLSEEVQEEPVHRVCMGEEQSRSHQDIFKMAKKEKIPTCERTY